MIKKILYYPYKVASSMKASGLNTEAFISISDKTFNPVLDQSFNNQLLLKFDDSDTEGDLFTIEQAYLIKNFVDELPDSVEVIHVHCLMGVSRSRAVVKALLEYFDIPFDHFHKCWNTTNKHVYKLLSKVLIPEKSSLDSEGYAALFSEGVYYER